MCTLSCHYPFISIWRVYCIIYLNVFEEALRVLAFFPIVSMMLLFSLLFDLRLRFSVQPYHTLMPIKFFFHFFIYPCLVAVVKVFHLANTLRCKQKRNYYDCCFFPALFHSFVGFSFAVILSGAFASRTPEWY